ncbi:MAG: Rpp14/Pop5 family protein [Candidatus Bathyarchaeia archaeon]
MLRKVKRRYLALKVDSASTVEPRELLDAVWGSVTKLFGEYGASKTGLMLVEYDVERRLAVLRVANAAVDMVRAALATVTKAGDGAVALHVVAVSGTIKALYKKTKNRQN